MSLENKALNKINKKLEELRCRPFESEAKDRLGIMAIVNDLYGNADIENFYSAYESVLSNGSEKENIIGMEGESVYKEIKSIARYAFSLYYDIDFSKKLFLRLIEIQAARFFKEMDQKERDFSKWTEKIDFLWWVNSVLTMLMEDATR